jgi:hypothetical protein
MAVQRELDGGAITLRGRVGDSGCQHAGGTETPTRGPIADSTESLWNVTAACHAECYTVPLERFVAKRMGATTFETDSSHVPMLSQPDFVLDVIRKAAKAVMEKTES